MSLPPTMVFQFKSVWGKHITTNRVQHRDMYAFLNYYLCVFSVLYTKYMCCTFSCICQQSKQTNSRLPSNYPVLISIVLFSTTAWVLLLFTVLFQTQAAVFFMTSCTNDTAASIPQQRWNACNFHLWNYQFPGVFPTVKLVSNEEQFSWMGKLHYILHISLWRMHKTSGKEKCCVNVSNI